MKFSMYALAATALAAAGVNGFAVQTPARFAVRQVRTKQSVRSTWPNFSFWTNLNIALQKPTRKAAQWL